MSTSEELRAAAAVLRPSSPAVAHHTVAVRLAPAVATTLAELLESEAEYANDSRAAHPTHLVRALAVARAINGGQR